MVGPVGPAWDQVEMDEMILGWIRWAVKQNGANEKWLIRWFSMVSFEQKNALIFDINQIANNAPQRTCPFHSTHHNDKRTYWKDGLYQYRDMIDPNGPNSHFGTQRYKIKLLLRDLTIRTKVMREMTRWWDFVILCDVVDIWSQCCPAQNDGA